MLLGGHAFEVRDGSSSEKESSQSGSSGTGSGDGASASASASVSARDRFVSLAAARPPGRGLLSVSNHTSTLDDPGLFAAMLPLSLFATDHLGGVEEEEEKKTGGTEESGKEKGENQGNLVGGGRAVRWSLCASDICFNKGKIISDFFLAGKTLPVERFGSKGVAQPATEAAAEVLRGGGWVHLFPEGRVELSGRLPPAPSKEEGEGEGEGDAGSSSSFYSSTTTLLSRAWGLVASGQSSKKREAAAAEEEGDKSKEATTTATAAATTTTTTKNPLLLLPLLLAAERPSAAAWEPSTATASTGADSPRSCSPFIIPEWRK